MKYDIKFNVIWENPPWIAIVPFFIVDSAFSKLREQKLVPDSDGPGSSPSASFTKMYDLLF